MSFRCLADLHHTALYYSLQLLFDKRLDWELYRPIGVEWFNEGYWMLYPGIHPHTVQQYLTLEQCFKRDVHGFLLPERMKLNDHYTVEDGIHYVFDPSTQKVQRAVTLEKFKETQFDIVISSVPSHIPLFNKLIQNFQPRAKHIFQVGNAWGHLPGVQNILASTEPFQVPQGINACFYHQEFDLDLFSYTPPTNHKKVSSFIHYMREMELNYRYRQVLQPQGWEFMSWGAGMEGDLCYMGDIAQKMQEMGWLWHQKIEGDGYGHCYSDDTEILTENGWKLFRDRLCEEKVATLNPKTGVLEYQLPTEAQQYSYKGDMCHFDSRIMDVLVTPNHRMWVEHYNDDSQSLGWRFEEAQDMTYINKCPRHRVGLKVAADQWNGQETCSLEWARFLGWYMAEGCVHSIIYLRKTTNEMVEGSPALCISNSNIQYLEEVKTLLDPADYYHSTITKIKDRTGSETKMYRKNGEPCPHKTMYILCIPSRELYNKFKVFGQSHEKFVPQEVLNGTREILWSFLETFTLGDGHIDQRLSQKQLSKLTRIKRTQSVQKNDSIHNISTDKSTSLEINLSSKRLIDNLQEVAIKLGLRSRIRRKKPAGVGKQWLWSINITIALSTNYQSMLNKKKLYRPFQKVPYQGMVYCVTVPNGLLFTRRNGIPVVSGNSIHNAYACGRPMIGNCTYYRGKLGSHLLQDQQTCLDISRYSVHEASQLLNRFAEPDTHTRMCEAARKRFDEVCNFDAEFEKIKAFLGNLK